jgi:GDP-D-mannose 3',5'-epimerase
MNKHDLLVVARAGGFISGHPVQKPLEEGFKKLRAVDQKPVSDWYEVVQDVENLSLDLKKADACRDSTKVHNRFTTSLPIWAVWDSSSS